MNADKKSTPRNKSIMNLINTGKEKEKDIVASSVSKEVEVKQIEIPEAVKEETTSPVIENVEVGERVEAKLSEKIPADKKDDYQSLLKKRLDKEVYEKTNITTKHRNLLKKIAMAENLPLQDLLANILDEFEKNYSSEISKSNKKLLSM